MLHSYIIEDLITGGDLMSYIEQRANDPISESEGAFIVYQILKAIEHLHSKGIAHRDLKPENVWLSRPVAEARVIVTDFGQSIQAADDRKSKPRRLGTCCGTISYVAPY